jgi:hypothetical protein
MFCAREVDKSEPGGFLLCQKEGDGTLRDMISKEKKKLDTVPLAQTAILERPHTDFPYPQIVCFRVVGGLGGTGISSSSSSTIATGMLLRRAMGLQKASDGVNRCLESEVTKEESGSGRLFLRGEGFSREFRLAFPLTLGVTIVQHSGFRRAALKAVAFGGWVKDTNNRSDARTVLDEKATSFQRLLGHHNGGLLRV